MARTPPLAAFRGALAFLTRLPLGRPRGAAPALADCAWAFPLAGLVVGLIGALAYRIAYGLDLPPLISALIAVAATALATGALHEDGLADTIDGLGGGRDRQRKLDIMRDSRLGGFGGLALVFSVGLRAAALASLAAPPAATAALIGGHAISRGLLPAVMAWSRPARHDGLGAMAGTPSGGAALGALAIGLVIAFFAAGFGTGLLAALIAWLGALLLLGLARRQIGGYTGDVLGALQQAAEILFFLVLVASR